MEKWQPFAETDVPFVNWYNFANSPYSSRVNMMTAEDMIRGLLREEFLINELTVEAILEANRRCEAPSPTIASSLMGDGDLVQMLPVWLDPGYGTEAVDAITAKLNPGFNRKVLKIARLDLATLFFGLDMPLGVYHRAA